MINKILLSILILPIPSIAYEIHIPSISADKLWSTLTLPAAQLYKNGRAWVKTRGKEDTNGFTITSDAPNKKVYEYTEDSGNSTAKVRVFFRGKSAFYAVVTEGKSLEGEFSEVISFGEQNSVVRKTVCKERRCFVISKDICTGIEKTMGRSLDDILSDSEKCTSLAASFKSVMESQKSSGTLDADFKTDMQTLGNSLSRSKGVIMGLDIQASISSLYGVIRSCKEMNSFNKAPHSSPPTSTALPASSSSR